MNQPTVLSLECPKLRAAMSDISLTQRWEVLRRSANPLTTHALADACGVSDGVAQHTLDLLVEAGVAKSRADALAWCVRLVGKNSNEWLGSLRSAMDDVARLRASGPSSS